MSLINIPKLRKRLGIRRIGNEGPDRIVMEGTSHETPVFINDSGVDGPNAIVVGGQHGSETVGIDTAWRLAQAEIGNGTLTVIPEANALGCKRDSYVNPQFGDINDLWNAGGDIQCPLNRELWDVIQDQHPDMLIDLHSSGGIYEAAPDGVGQCVFPSPSGRKAAHRAVNLVNDNYLGPSDFPDKYNFSLGNNQNDGDKGLLSHRCGYQWAKPAYIIETTRHGTTLDQRNEWEYAMAVQLLRENGLRIG